MYWPSRSFRFCRVANSRSWAQQAELQRRLLLCTWFWLRENLGRGRENARGSPGTARTCTDARRPRSALLSATEEQNTFQLCCRRSWRSNLLLLAEERRAERLWAAFQALQTSRLRLFRRTRTSFRFLQSELFARQAREYRAWKYKDLLRARRTSIRRNQQLAWENSRSSSRNESTLFGFSWYRWSSTGHSRIRPFFWSQK